MRLRVRHDLLTYKNIIHEEGDYLRIEGLRTYIVPEMVEMIGQVYDFIWRESYDKYYCEGWYWEKEWLVDVNRQTPKRVRGNIPKG